MSVLGAALIAVALTGMESASANAANPQPTTQAVGTINGNGTVTVVMSGTWTWPGQNCKGRYSEGYSVDWWGISASPTPNPNFSLTNATEVPSAGQSTTGTITPVGTVVNNKIAGLDFHVAQYYSGEDVNSAATCTDTGSTSSGSWTASATYPNQADIPPQICVNFYDTHGSEGKPSNNTKDYSPSGDDDNSINTNNFNPAAGAGYCSTPHLVNSGMLSGHIYLCVNGVPTATEVPGGTLAATGPVNLSAISNPLAPQSVPVGTYTVGATAPATYAFVSCGGAATIGAPPTTASTSVNVPVNGTGTAIFYVAKPPVAPNLIAGHIYLCSNGNQTVTEVPGGTLSAVGPSTITATGNPLAPQAVNAGAFVMSASAPANYVFDACGATGVSIGAGSTSATQPVTVPTGGTGTGIFYVDPASVPNNPNITLALVKGNNADGSGYKQSETAPAPGADVPFRVVMTNTSSVAVVITSLTDSWPGTAPFSPTCATAIVGTTLAPGASATCDFTVPAYAPAAGTSVTNTALVTGCQATLRNNCGAQTATSVVTTIASRGSGSITLVVSKTNDANGSGTYAQTETAQSVGENVPFRVAITNNSQTAVTIVSLSDAWPGAAPFSPTCAAQVIGTTLAPGASTTCDFTVASYSPAAGTARTDTVNVVGCQVDLSSNCGTFPANSTVDSPPPTAAASSATLAFTGPPPHLQLMLEIGFSLLSLGSFLVWWTRPRRARMVRS
ncbi:MAG: DUF7507 domain-containing protein [Acidimicrobiales bacterium]